jgi:hypothetical protein
MTEPLRHRPDRIFVLPTRFGIKHLMQATAVCVVLADAIRRGGAPSPWKDFVFVAIEFPLLAFGAFLLMTFLFSVLFDYMLRR